VSIHGSHDDGFSSRRVVAAAPCRVLDALTTLDGLAGWWTPTVSGDPSASGIIDFVFGNEHVGMRVERADADSIVWRCVRHSKFPEWADTTIRFALGEPTASAGTRTQVTFHHDGLVSTLDCYGLCARGWQRYLDSLTAYVETGAGSPWGTETWRPATA
jgi:uncharacterized protein YndB with AHSA1/START domain